jgi:hypothetical protein
VRANDRFDLGQCRALLVASLRHNLRHSGRSIGLASGNQAGGLVTVAVMQLLVGGLLSVPLWGGMPAFPIAVLHFTYLILTVAAMLVLEAHTLVVSPADYDLVAPRPVSARTFFAARVGALLAFVLLVALAQGLPLLAAYGGAGGWQPRCGLLALAALISVTLTTAAAVVTLQGLVLHRVPPARLRTALTVLQLTTSLALYGLLVLLPGALGRAYLLEPIAARPAWLWVVPSTWAAHLLTPEGGTWWAVAVAGALPAAAWWLASRWLALDYAAKAVAAGARTDARAYVLPGFRSAESRAVGLLVRAQFRHDMRFRLGVLAIIPLTIVYLLLGVVDEDLASRGDGHPAMVYVAVMLFPLLLKGAFARSDSYAAAWVFYASPVNAGRLLLGQRTVLVTWFLAPYVAAIGLLLLYVLPSPGEALLSVIVVSLLTHALLLLAFIVDPALPFSSPPQVGASTKGVMVSVLPAILLAQVLPPWLNHLAAAFWLAAAAVLVLVSLNVALDAVLRRRLDRLSARAEFAS